MNAHFQVDSSGFFWTSSRSGLIRYDGNSLLTIKPKKGDQLLEPNITSKVFQTRDGSRWFSSDNAIHCLGSDKDTMQSWSLTDARNTYHYAFHLEADSLLWCVAGDTLFKKNIHRSTEEATKWHALEGFLLAPWIGKKGNILGIARPLGWDGTGFELLRYLPNGDYVLESYFQSAKGSTVDTIINNIFIEREDQFWIPSNVGLIRFNPFQPEDYSFVPLPIKDLVLVDVAIWKKNLLWIATASNGLFLYDLIQEDFVLHEPYLNIEGTLQVVKNIQRIGIDKEDNLWISIWNNGIIHGNLKNVKFDQLLPSNFLYGNDLTDVTSIVAHGATYYFSIVKSGLLFLKEEPNGDSKIGVVNIANVNPSDVKELLIDAEGLIWIRCINKIIGWHPDTETIEYRISPSKPTSKIATLDKHRLLLLGGQHLTLFDKKQGRFKTLLEGQSFSNLLVDSLNKLLFLTRDGNNIDLYSLDQDFELVDSYANIGSPNSLYASALDSCVYLATSTGLFKYDHQSKHIRKCTMKNASLDHSFVSIMQDQSGYLWLAAYNGMFRYEPNTKELHHFTASDGLYNLNFYENSVAIDDQGRLLFGGNHGITRFDPTQLKLNLSSPKIILKTARQNGEIQENQLFFDSLNSAPFSNKQNRFEFNYAFIEYSDPKQNQFKVFLIKNKKDTIWLSNSPEVILPKLTYGRYMMHAYAANSDQWWNYTQPHKLFFEILPPWHRSNWAILLWGTIIVAILYGIYRAIIRRIEKRESRKRAILEQEKKAAELRQKAADYKRQVAETQNAILRLQMKPHFLFNSMNAIRRYIEEKDIDTASSYLTHFANLMRRILHQAKLPLTDLDEEMALLKHYLETEQMRLSNKFQYAFVVESDLDEEDILMPTMILQPFIENAIWHGIAPKNGDGKIFIRFKTLAKTLICEVEDNGVGRAYHQAENQFRKTHKSASIAITKDRLALISAKYKQQAKLEIIDLKDIEEYPKGTLIRILLPLID